DPATHVLEDDERTPVEHDPSGHRHPHSQLSQLLLALVAVTRLQLRAVAVTSKITGKCLALFPELLQPGTALRDQLVLVLGIVLGLKVLIVCHRCSSSHR